MQMAQDENLDHGEWELPTTVLLHRQSINIATGWSILRWDDGAKVRLD